MYRICCEQSPCTVRICCITPIGALMNATTKSETLSDGRLGHTNTVRGDNLVLRRQRCHRFFRFDRGRERHGHRSSRAARRSAISCRIVAIGAEYGPAAPRGRYRERPAQSCLRWSQRAGVTTPVGPCSGMSSSSWRIHRRSGRASYIAPSASSTWHIGQRGLGAS